jgi:hypothetical protein
VDTTQSSVYYNTIKSEVLKNNFSCTKSKEFCVLNKWRINYYDDEYNFMPKPLHIKKIADIPAKDIEVLISDRTIDVPDALYQLDKRYVVIESYLVSALAIEDFSMWFLFLATNTEKQDLLEKKLDNLFTILINKHCPVNFVDVCIKHLHELSISSILYKRLGSFLDKSIEDKNLNLSRFFAFKLSGLDVKITDIYMTSYDYQLKYFGDPSNFIFKILNTKLDHKNEILKYILILIIKILCNNNFDTEFNKKNIAYLQKNVLTAFSMLYVRKPSLLHSILKHLQIIVAIKQTLLKPSCEDKINLCEITCASIFKIINNDNIYQIEDKLFQLDNIIPFHGMKIIFQKLYKAKLANIDYDNINDKINFFIHMAKMSIP